MKKNFLPVVIFLFSACSSCGPGKSGNKQLIPSDVSSVAEGKDLFTLNCAICHSFNQDSLGPRLNGITHQLDPDSIRSFIRNPQLAIASGNKRAVALVEKFSGSMPPFGGFSDEQLNDILAFLNTK